MRLAVLHFVALGALLAQPQASSPTGENGSPLLSIAPASDGLQFGAQLPTFEAKDITGRTWRLEDLRGKLTFIYIWNTGEARLVDAVHPHMRELNIGLSDLPEVERFYDGVRQKKNVQVLTFCYDYDYTHASEYMKERKYSFPVITDWVLTRKLFPGGINPPYWIVDRDARVSAPIPWRLGRVLDELERRAK